MDGVRKSGTSTWLEGFLMARTWTSPCGKVLLVIGLMLAIVQAAGAQGFGGGVSGVGYVDNALPGNYFRERAEAVYDINRSDRAEYIYLRGADSKIDYQDLSSYLELLLAKNFSGFIDIHEHFVNPTQSPNASGLGDSIVGFEVGVPGGREPGRHLPVANVDPNGQSRQDPWQRTRHDRAGLAAVRAPDEWIDCGGRVQGLDSPGERRLCRQHPELRRGRQLWRVRIVRVPGGCAGGRVGRMDSAERKRDDRFTERGSAGRHPGG